MQKNVVFLSHMLGDQLKEEIRRSMFVVLLSEWYENNPRSLIEGFALGKCAIGADIGGIPELVKDNETGLLFKMGDSCDLASKMKYLSNRPDLIRDMGRNARRFVEKELNPEKHYEGLMRIYKIARLS